MRAGARERTTLDLRGLGPAIRAHAKARNLAVSSVARMAVAKLLESSGSAVAETLDANPGACTDSVVKMTLRLSPRTARDIATRSRATGLSHGAYVSTLLEGAPLAVDHRQAVSALATSTDRLASIATDLNGFARLMRRGTLPSADHVDDVVAAAVREVRAHLRVAARLVSDLRPRAASRRRGGSGGPGSATTP
ncbi:MAG: hypothetical protein ABIM89_12645 [Mycobacteriales bacterium]